MIPFNAKEEAGGMDDGKVTQFWEQGSHALGLLWRKRQGADLVDTSDSLNA